LIWGDADPISPLAVGRHLAARMPKAALRVVAGGDHMFASTRAAEVAPLISSHFA
jgi:pimeloyl-ACP methyl ester carboxylesterase